MRITSDGALAFGGAAYTGDSGQVLTSAGDSAVPTWENAGGGGSSPWTTSGDNIYRDSKVNIGTGNVFNSGSECLTLAASSTTTTLADMDGPDLTIRNYDDTTGNYGSVRFMSYASTAINSAIVGITTNHDEGYGELAFMTRTGTPGGSSTFSEQMRITEDGAILNYGATMSVTTETANAASCDVTENGQDQMLILNIPTLDQDYTINIPDPAAVPAGRKLIIAPLDARIATNAGSYELKITAGGGKIATTQSLVYEGNDVATLNASVVYVSAIGSGEAAVTLQLTSDGENFWVDTGAFDAGSGEGWTT